MLKKRLWRILSGSHQFAVISVKRGVSLDACFSPVSHKNVRYQYWLVCALNFNKVTENMIFSWEPPAPYKRVS